MILGSVWGSLLSVRPVVFSGVGTSGKARRKARCTGLSDGAGLPAGLESLLSLSTGER